MKARIGKTEMSLTIADRNGLKLIGVADLLANDRGWQGDALHITTISDIKGGTIVGSYNSTTQEWTPPLSANEGRPDSECSNDGQRTAA